MILKMLDGFTSRVTDGNIDALLDAVEPYRVDAVAHALTRFRTEEVEGYDARFPPTVPQLVKQVRLFDEVLRKIDRDREERPKLVTYPIGGEPPPGAVALGPIAVDFGQGPIDMSKMTPAEKDAVFANRGLPPPAQGDLPMPLPKLRSM